MKKAAIFILLSLFSFEVAAATKTATAYEMRVSVVLGERSTRFFVKSSGHSGILKIVTGAGQNGQKQLEESESELLLQTYLKLPSGNNVPASCYRSKIEIVVTRAGHAEEQKAGCFGVSSSAEPAFRHFANLLAQPF